MKNQDIEAVTRYYLITALWTNAEDLEVVLEPGRNSNVQALSSIVEEMPEETIKRACADCLKFVKENEADLAASGMDSEDIGYNFWLNRNGHGTGFCDRDLDDVGARLDHASHAFGETWIYKGDDELIYLS